MKTNCASCRKEIGKMNYNTSEERYKEIGNFCFNCLKKVNESLARNTAEQRREAAELLRDEI